MKTKPALGQAVGTVVVTLDKPSDEAKFRLWFENHGRREWVKWKCRQEYNKPPMDLKSVLPGKKEAG